MIENIDEKNQNLFSNDSAQVGRTKTNMRNVRNIHIPGHKSSKDAYY